MNLKLTCLSSYINSSVHKGIYKGSILLRGDHRYIIAEFEYKMLILINLSTGHRLNRHVEVSNEVSRGRQCIPYRLLTTLIGQDWRDYSVETDDL